VLRGILRSSREKVAGGWREMCDEEIHALYCFPDVVRVIRRMRWVGNVDCIVELEKHTEINGGT
jgi:hypothetical protein